MYMTTKKQLCSILDSFISYSIIKKNKMNKGISTTFLQTLRSCHMCFWHLSINKYRYFATSKEKHVTVDLFSLWLLMKSTKSKLQVIDL